MAYIIINGKSSETIKGLLIQSLPPITKPKMRVDSIEIDGRDGDIVTELGYSAYDKTIKIGLFDKFRIDDIIAYFTSKGSIIFSNEPDKYYNFSMLDQIDFNKLIRFKTADVNFHIQPYKYSVTQGEKVITPDSNSFTINNSGNTVALPTVNIVGSGVINIYLNGLQIFTVNMPVNQTNITIDAEAMEAYNNNGLQNRAVSGNYDNFKLITGINTISWTGNVTRVSISKYSRWI